MKFSSFLTTAVAIAAITVMFQTAEADCGRCNFGVVSCNASCHVVIGTACDAGVCQTACDSAVIMPSLDEQQAPTPVEPQKPTPVEQPAIEESEDAAVAEEAETAAEETEVAAEKAEVAAEEAEASAEEEVVAKPIDNEEEVADVVPEAPAVEEATVEEPVQSVKEMVENGTKD